ncbi:MAG: polysaccharide biosynthesis protein, partial [Candidatus Sulfotelmatobacter sp.]
MGATKRLAELVLFTHPETALQRKAVRLGNVLGSSGSVGPIFLKQIMEGGPVTVTHRDARRFFLTLDHAVILLMTALSPEYKTGILIPDLGPAKRVEELARYLIAATARERQGIEILFTGLRPGDKVEEHLSAPDERVLAQENDLFSIIQSEQMAATAVHTIVEQISLSVRHRDLRLLLETICKAVPEYRPGHVLEQAIQSKRQAELRK